MIVVAVDVDADEIEIARDGCCGERVVNGVIDAAEADDALDLAGVCDSGEIFLEFGEFCRIAFNLHPAPAKIADEMAGVAEIDAVPCAKFDAPLVFGANDAKELLENSVLAILRVDLAGMLIEETAGAVPPVEVDDVQDWHGPPFAAPKRLVNMRRRLSPPCDPQGLTFTNYAVEKESFSGYSAIRIDWHGFCR